MLVTVSVEKLTPGSFGWAAILRGPNGNATLHWSTDLESVERTASTVAQALGVTVIGDLVFAGEAHGPAGHAHLITRAEALKAVGLRDDQRITWRNYELEERLKAVINVNVVINEWCPFNGFWCAWADFAPVDVLEDRAQEMHGWKNYEAAQYLRSKILERQKVQVE